MAEHDPFDTDEADVDEHAITERRMSGHTRNEQTEPEPHFTKGWIAPARDQHSAPRMAERDEQRQRGMGVLIETVTIRASL